MNKWDARNVYKIRFQWYAKEEDKYQKYRNFDNHIKSNRMYSIFSNKLQRHGGHTRKKVYVLLKIHKAPEVWNKKGKYIALEGSKLYR